MAPPEVPNTTKAGHTPSHTYISDIRISPATVGESIGQLTIDREEEIPDREEYTKPPPRDRVEGRARL